MNVVASTVRYTKRKQFQADVTVSCLQNQENVIEGLLASKFLHFLRDRGTPHYFRNMLFDVFQRQDNMTHIFSSFLSNCASTWRRVI